ncbi:MAG: hypothetical protein K1X39_11900 [Thermoflexales bacterium]|nr:hypothetical protein [Thermoflexales bacterium]
MLTALLAFLVTFGLLLLLARLANQLLQALGLLLTGRRDSMLLLYAVLLLPGVTLHELSHAAMARLLGVRVRRMSLLPAREGDRIRLGFVEMDRMDAFRSSLVGAAPLLIGTLVLGLIGLAVFDGTRLNSALLGGDLNAILQQLGAVFRAPDAWVWFYIVFAVANSMTPSPSDMQSWPPVVVFLAIISLLALALGGESLARTLAPTVRSILLWLSTAFGLTAFIDAIAVFVLAVLCWGVGRLTGRQVDFR